MLSRSPSAWIREVVGRALFASRVYKLSGAERGVVVAFHRVNDTADPSGLTVPSEMFEQFCHFFARYFKVVSLTQFVDQLEMGQSVGGLLSITFDDGYRDNYDIAAPILKRLRLPATFFVTTEFIGTDFVPAWDQKVGLSFPWMNWDQVRALHRDGFEIGAHTKRHVDLGKVAGDRAREEIQGSQADLEGKLGSAVRLFAYPFGRADQITESNRELVKASEFRCCCSCFGGMNAKFTDPFAIQRVPISTWFTSPFHFGFEVATHKC